MAVLTQPAVGAPAHVAAMVHYSKRPPKHEEQHLYTYVGERPAHLPSHTNIERDTREVLVHNLAHPSQQHFKPTLQEQGFTVAPFQLPKGLDWNDDANVRSLLYPALDKLLRQQTGASRTLLFDYTKRKGQLNDNISMEQMQRPDAENRRGPVGRVHVDYTLKSGIGRLRELLPEEAERLMKTPFAVIQMWLPIKTIDASPLGMIDASTVSEHDLIPNAIYFPGRTGWTFALSHNPAHRWYFHQGLTTDEAYVFVCYDSRAGRARFTPHTGFIDPSTAPDAPARESVEARAYVFWETEPAAEPALEMDPTHSFHKPDQAGYLSGREA